MCRRDRACKSDVDCETQEPIMADDGSGADITIPSFLMTKPDGETIKSHLEGKRLVQVSGAAARASATLEVCA
jgi:hypothetical protein